MNKLEGETGKQKKATLTRRNEWDREEKKNLWMKGQRELEGKLKKIRRGVQSLTFPMCEFSSNIIIHIHETHTNKMCTFANMLLIIRPE